MAKINKTNEAYVEDADLTILADLLSYFIKSLLLIVIIPYIRFDDPNCPKHIKLDIADSTVIIKNKNAICMKNPEKESCD